MNRFFFLFLTKYIELITAKNKHLIIDSSWIDDNDNDADGAGDKDDEGDDDRYDDDNDEGAGGDSTPYKLIVGVHRLGGNAIKVKRLYRKQKHR